VPPNMYGRAPGWDNAANDLGCLDSSPDEGLDLFMLIGSNSTLRGELKGFVSTDSHAGGTNGTRRRLHRQ